jgi:hypothetical protein
LAPAKLVDACCSKYFIVTNKRNRVAQSEIMYYIPSNLKKRKENADPRSLLALLHQAYTFQASRLSRAFVIVSLLPATHPSLSLV